MAERTGRTLRLGTRTREEVAEDVWGDALRRVEEGDPPPAPALATLVETWGVPESARAYVADRIRGDKQGPPGTPPLGTTAWLIRINVKRWMIAEVERRARRYARVRLDAPRSKVAHRDGVVLTFPAPASKKLLWGSRNVSGDWTRASGGKWKLRAPVDYAIRRVAFRWGFDPERLRRWRKDRAKLPTIEEVPAFSLTSNLWGVPRDSW